MRLKPDQKIFFHFGPCVFDIEMQYIILEVKEQDNILHFYVKNTGSEMEEDLLVRLKSHDITPHGHGIGLINIDKRVKMQYGDEYGLRLYNEEDYAVAELIIPKLQGDQGC